MTVDLSAAAPTTCGGKAGTLGLLLRAGLPVPDGFVVPFGSDPPDERGLTTRLAPMGPVAVRSSADAEDTATTSAAGQHDTFLAVVGARAVAERIRACRDSLWTPRAVAYRRALAGPPDPKMAVLIQRHVDADVAGVLFTGGSIRIEATWGLGESVVHGLVTPDAWTLAPDGITHRAGDKRVRVDRTPDRGTRHQEVSAADRFRSCLTDNQVARIAELGRRVESLLGTPTDLEWALAGNEFWILQARPITVAPPSAAPAEPGVLRGTPGSAGTATGPTRILTGPADFPHAKPGDIIVCHSTDPAWTPLFAIAAGFVTETGGVLSHAAIVAREHGIPAVLGVPEAITTLRDIRELTLHGDTGTIHPIPPPLPPDPHPR